MKQIGKIGRRNIKANKKLKEMFFDKEIIRCEVGFCGCMNGAYLSFAHKHKREWYRKQPELLSDFNEVVLACIPCHEKMEVSKEITQSVFDKLRP